MPSSLISKIASAKAFNSVLKFGNEDRTARIFLYHSLVPAKPVALSLSNQIVGNGIKRLGWLVTYCLANNTLWQKALYALTGHLAVSKNCLMIFFDSSISVFEKTELFHKAVKAKFHAVLTNCSVSGAFSFNPLITLKFGR